MHEAVSHGVLVTEAMTELTTIARPQCRTAATETMPTDRCQYFHECRACGVVLRPTLGACCVFCSYADRPCPPVQASASGGQCEWSVERVELFGCLEER